MRRTRWPCPRPGFLLACALAACAHVDLDGDGDNAAASPGPAAGPREVVVDPSALSTIGIVVAPALVGQLPRSLDLAGTLALDPAHEARAPSPVGGTLTRILVHPGDVVTAGEALAWVRSSDVAEARAAWSSADARRIAAFARRDRLKLLLTGGGASQAQLLDAEAGLADANGATDAAAARLALYGVGGGSSAGASASPEAPVRTPIAGTVLEANASVGAFVSPDAALFHIGDPDHLWLVLAVPDARVDDVAIGQAATFRVDGGDPGEPGASFHATVASVGRWVDPVARTVAVRATVQDPERLLRPNQFARVTLDLSGPEADAGIVLPGEAVQTVDGHDVVFIEGEPGHFRVQRVDVAERAGERARLRTGDATSLQPGQLVVVAGAFTLKGELVKGAMGGDDD